MLRRGRSSEQTTRTPKEDCGVAPAKKMKAEARKMTIVRVDALTEVCDVGAESDRRSCIAWQ